MRHWRMFLCEMIFYETDVFTSRITELIDDESYAAF